MKKEIHNTVFNVHSNISLQDTRSKFNAIERILTHVKTSRPNHFVWLSSVQYFTFIFSFELVIKLQ